MSILIGTYPASVYVAVGNPTPIVKVGMSYDPNGRRSCLHMDYNFLLKGNGEPCTSFTLVHCENLETNRAAYAVETATHDLLDCYRNGIGAEWFDVDPNIAIEAVKKACEITNYGLSPYKRKIPRPSRLPKKMYVWNDQSFTVSRWSIETGVGEQTIRYRLSKGWSVGQAVGLESPPER